MVLKINLFIQMLSHVLRGNFDELVSKCQSGKHSKVLKSWIYLVRQPYYTLFPDVCLTPKK